MKTDLKITFFVIFFTLTVFRVSAQERDPYGLGVVTTVYSYLNSINLNPNMEMVDIEKVVNGIRLDIRYATDNNFTGQVIYPASRAFARLPVAMALQKVQDSLAHHNAGLRVYDAYRPYSATLKFFEVWPDTSFVADPRTGSRHNRGCAVDVTLVDPVTGEEFRMPSAFDDFSDCARPWFTGLPPEVIANRELLFGIMSCFGFTHHPGEWWHFDYQEWENYGLMDISFEELDRVSEQKMNGCLETKQTRTNKPGP